MTRTVEKDEVKEKRTWKQEAGYDVLATEIVNLAIQDYKKEKQRNNPSGVLALQRFFRSEWCQLLCNIDGELLIESCDKECEKLRIRREKRKNGKIQER